MERIYNLIKIKPLAMIIYVVVTVFVLSGLLVDRFIGTVSGERGVEGFRHSVADVAYDHFVAIQSNEIVSTLLLFLAMAVVGAVLYEVANLLFGLGKSLLDHIRVTFGYTKAEDFSNILYWISYSFFVALKLVIVTSGLLYLVILVRVIVPAGREFASYPGNSWYSMVLAFVLLLVSQHILVVITRLAGYNKLDTV